jgi:hypothetical protein
VHEWCGGRVRQALQPGCEDQRLPERIGHPADGTCEQQISADPRFQTRAIELPRMKLPVPHGIRPFMSCCGCAVGGREQSSGNEQQQCLEHSGAPFSRSVVEVRRAGMMTKLTSTASEKQAISTQLMNSSLFLKHSLLKDSCFLSKGFVKSSP